MPNKDKQFIDDSIVGDGSVTTTAGTSTNTGVTPTIEYEAMLSMGAGASTGTNVVTNTGDLGDVTDSYSWLENSANEAAALKNIEMKQAEANALASRNNIESNATRGQEQALMSKYSANQAIEKMGWTGGGYQTDINKQMEFLKSTIQADLYGQLELQKLGFETQIDIARLNYDLNRQRLSHQYYNEEWQREFQRASITGQLISPENRYLAMNYLAAKKNLETNPDDVHAQAVMQQVKDWYLGEGLDQAGVEALVEISQLTYNRQQYEFTQAQLQLMEVELNYGLSQTKNQIVMEGMIPIEIRNDSGLLLGYDAVDPKSPANAQEVAVVKEYYTANPVKFESEVNALEATQLNEWQRARDNEVFLGTYSEYLETVGDKAKDFFNKYKSGDQEFNDPFAGVYRNAKKDGDTGSIGDIPNTIIIDENTLANDPISMLASVNYPLTGQPITEQEIMKAMKPNENISDTVGRYLNAVNIYSETLSTGTKLDAKEFDEIIEVFASVSGKNKNTTRQALLESISKNQIKKTIGKDLGFIFETRVVADPNNQRNTITQRQLSIPASSVVGNDAEKLKSLGFILYMGSYILKGKDYLEITNSLLKKKGNEDRGGMSVTAYGGYSGVERD